MKPRRKVVIALLGVGVVAAALSSGVALRARRLRAEARARASATATPTLRPSPNAWPGAEARLVTPAVTFLPGFGARRIFVDAGHGAPGNTGNTSCFCVNEQDFTLAAAQGLAERLEATGHFVVRVSREGEQKVDYRARLDEAAGWRADALVSLHSDVRGRSDPWSPRPGQSCPMSLTSPGFSVLWSDEGDASLCDRRLALARAVAGRMQEAGFLPYLGAEYTGLYEADAAQAGVFVDRHAPEQRIFMLRRPSIPSILVETHHALDPREAVRWDDPRTLDVFAAATAAALVDALN